MFIEYYISILSLRPSYETSGTEPVTMIYDSTGYLKFTQWRTTTLNDVPVFNNYDLFI